MNNIILKNYLLLTEDENKNILEIRNSKNIRLASLNEDIITFENHLKWIENNKKDNANRYYAVFEGNDIVGAIYITGINTIRNTCSWGLYFKKNINIFTSSICTYLIIQKIFYELKINTLHLKVKKDNIAAYKFDTSFGFKKYDERNEQYFMYMNKIMWNDKKNTSSFTILLKKIEKIHYKFIEG